jgi:hypothetical protein
VPPELAEQAADWLADERSSDTRLPPGPAGGESGAGTAPPLR